MFHRKKPGKTQENPYFSLNYKEHLWVFLEFFPMSACMDEACMDDEDLQDYYDGEEAEQGKKTGRMTKLNERMNKRDACWFYYVLLLLFEMKKTGLSVCLFECFVLFGLFVWMFVCLFVGWFKCSFCSWCLTTLVFARQFIERGHVLMVLKSYICLC